MKKSNYYTSINQNFSSNKNLETNSIKTTDVNILLNRVRLDQKKTLKKRIIFSLFLATAISCLTIFFVISLLFLIKKFIETIKIYIISHLLIKWRGSSVG